MSDERMPSKDPDNIEPYFSVWCSKDGTNANTAADTGELKGATISTSAWSVIQGDVTVDSDDTSAITIAGIVYAINTVATVTLSGGTAGTVAKVRNRITTSDSRTLDKTLIIPIKEH